MNLLKSDLLRTSVSRVDCWLGVAHLTIKVKKTRGISRFPYNQTQHVVLMKPKIPRNWRAPQPRRTLEDAINYPSKRRFATQHHTLLNDCFGFSYIHFVHSHRPASKINPNCTIYDTMAIFLTKPYTLSTLLVTRALQVATLHSSK